jgi:hypothetical protein
MKKENLSLAIELARIIENEEAGPVVEDYAIVVADRGFVYVGKVVESGSFLIITEGSNIRYWGTERGLGQLVLEGPTKDSKLDLCGTVKIPMKAVISIHPTHRALWKK